MGYNSRIYGEFFIEPPLNADEMAAEPFCLPDPDFENLFKIRTEERSERFVTDDGAVGLLVITEGEAVVVADEGEWKYYDWEHQLESLIARHPTHSFTGTMIRIGDDQGDAERAIATGSDVKFEKARLLWPDGTAVEY